MTNYAAGHKAEKRAAKYLEKLGYKVIATNFKTRQYEIDLVAEYKRRLHFVEVKYRKTADQGTGFDYITPHKLSQMQYAAEMWVSEHGWDKDYTLSAIEVSGDNYEVTGYLPFLD